MFYFRSRLCYSNIFNFYPVSVQVDQLTKNYEGLKAVDGISFSARPGSILGFLGPNGAGKSTTMKILTGFIPPSSGRVTVAGMDIQQHSLEVRRKIGYLPEHNPLYLDLYVREALGFIASIHRLRNPRTKIDQAIEQTGLGDQARKKIGELSKGFRQRVGLAQAILHDPEVLILDEPTSGLDPNQIIGIRNLITELGKTKTVILSTHIMQEVEAICEQVVIIRSGRIVADDSLRKLMNDHPGKTLEQIFINLTN
jgi:ABC-2 type transport system ATP-binding protein